MRELDFVPDAVARSLRAGSDTAIGFVVESIADPFFAEVIDTVEAEMARHGRSVLVASTHRDPEQEKGIVRRLLQRRVGGLLVAPTGAHSAELGQSPCPVVLVDRPVPALSADLVDIDDRQAAFDAVTHLIRHGHRRIAYVGDDPRIPTSGARLRGYRDALEAAGSAVPEELVTTSAATTKDAAAVAHALLESGADLTAVFSASTRVSLGVVPVLHSRHRTDLAFVGFGDFPMADVLHPGVTVVDHSGARVGRAAASRLLARLEDANLPVTRLRLPAPLIARGSGELRP
jgi:LacI family transcriptional regulator